MDRVPDDLQATEGERREMPRTCPACGDELIVTGLDCSTCYAAIKGQFSPGPLARLTKEQQQFLLVFVRNRGNIRDVERELEISYPTVRARLDQLVAALNNGLSKDAKLQQQEILANLAKGGITASEAVQRLKSIAKP